MIGRSPHTRLDGAVVVVTGASSGIGRGTAVELCRRGAKVVLAARGVADLDDVVAICHDLPGEARAVPTDVSDADAVAALAEAAVGRFGRIDAWVNNAGVMAYGRYDVVPWRVHQQVLATNLVGAMHAAAVVVPMFREQEHGVLVNVASLYGEITTPDVTSYVTSKFALVGFSRALRRDMKRLPGVEVCCVLPSSIDTPIFRHAANHTGHRIRALAPAADPARVVRAVVGCIERPKAEVRIGWFGRVTAFSQQVAPWLYDVLVARAMEQLAFGDEQVDVTDGNVFEPATEWKQVTGGWRRHDLRRAGLGVGVLVAAGSAVTMGRRYGRPDRHRHRTAPARVLGRLRG